MTDEMSTYRRAHRLYEIKEEMLDLLKEAKKLLEGTSEQERARQTWWAHIRCALDEHHSYLDRSNTMQDTVEALFQEHELDDDEEVA